MAIHFALASTSSGIPLSGASAIWVKTSDDFCKRSAESSFAVPAQPNVARLTRDKNATNFFIDLLGPSCFEEQTYVDGRAQAIWSHASRLINPLFRVRLTVPSI